MSNDRPPENDQRVTETPEVWERLPFPLSASQRAAMYLQGWQGEHCSRLCLTGGADRCRVECELPSVRRTERNAKVAHGSAARARRRLEHSEQSRCLEATGLATSEGIDEGV